MWFLVVSMLVSPAVPATVSTNELDPYVVAAWLREQSVRRVPKIPELQVFTIQFESDSVVPPEELERLRQSVQGHPDHPDRERLEDLERWRLHGPDVNVYDFARWGSQFWLNRRPDPRSSGSPWFVASDGKVTWWDTPQRTVLREASRPLPLQFDLEGLRNIIDGRWRYLAAPLGGKGQGAEWTVAVQGATFQGRVAMKGDAQSGDAQWVVDGRADQSGGWELTALRFVNPKWQDQVVQLDFPRGWPDVAQVLPGLSVDVRRNGRREELIQVLSVTPITREEFAQRVEPPTAAVPRQGDPVATPPGFFIRAKEFVDARRSETRRRFEDLASPADRSAGQAERPWSARSWPVAVCGVVVLVCGIVALKWIRR